jgi:hypothetical protein
MKENWAERPSPHYLTILSIAEIIYTTEQAWSTGGMILRGKLKYSKKKSTKTTFCTTNSTRTGLKLNLVLCGKKVVNV